MHSNEQLLVMSIVVGMYGRRMGMWGWGCEGHKSLHPGATRASRRGENRYENGRMVGGKW